MTAEAFLDQKTRPDIKSKILKQGLRSFVRASENMSLNNITSRSYPIYLRISPKEICFRYCIDLPEVRTASYITYRPRK